MTAEMVDAAFEATSVIPGFPEGAPFQQGEMVAYPSHGVGTVDRVGIEEVAGHRLNLIRVSFADNRMTLRIPVARAQSLGLRRLASPEALAAVLVTLRGRRRISKVMWAKRAQLYLGKINSGDVTALAEVVRDLQLGADGSGASSSQRNLFEIAIDRLAGEFAAASGIEKETAMDLLTRTLRQGTSVEPEVIEEIEIAAAC